MNGRRKRKTVSRIKPMQPLSLSREWVTLNNQVNACQQAWSLELAETVHHVRISNRAIRVGLDGGLWLIWLSINGCKLGLVLNRLPISDTALCRVLEGSPVDELPTDLKIFLVRHVMGEQMASLSRQSETEIKVMDVVSGLEDLTNYPYKLGLSVSVEAQSKVEGMIVFSDCFLPYLKTILGVWPKEENQNGGMNLNTRLLAGSVDLAMDVLQSVSIGDVLMIPGYDPSRLSVSIGSYLIECHMITSGTWEVVTLTNDLHLLSDEMTADQILEARTTRQNVNNKQETDDTLSNEGDLAEESTAESKGVDIQQLSVKITFDMGDLVLTLADLKNLKEGDVLELNPSKQVINVRCNDHLIARGEMVNIEDSVGVLIQHLVTA